MALRSEKHSRPFGMDGQQGFLLEPATLRAARGRWGMLRGLVAAGAGFHPKAVGPLPRWPEGPDVALVIFCVRGGGWCETGGRLEPVRGGDLVVLPPGLDRGCGGHVTSPWTIHWVGATGELVGAYLEELGVSRSQRVLPVGEAPAVVGLFNEVFHDLRTIPAPWNVFHASHSLAHLFSTLIRQRGRTGEGASPTVHKVAQAITFMSEHLNEPLPVGELAALASLSPAHFTALFREQTGTSPHAYLHLLRMHRAVRWLTETGLSVKEIAARLGFKDPFHFSRTFKAFTGQAPTDYRRGGRPSGPQDPAAGRAG